MPIFSIILVSTGLLFLLLSLKPALNICQQDGNIGWRILMLLIVFFAIAYLSYLYYLSSVIAVTFVENSLSTILMAGGLFVFLVINFSFKSILKIQHIAEQEHHNSLHDSLTGLPNRTCFLDTIKEKIDNSHAFSIFVLNINNFKHTNDLVGHYFADQLLIKIANSIRSQLPETCFFARIGGDEFALVSNAITKTEISDINEGIHNLSQSPYHINGYNLKINFSLGCTLFPENSRQMATLLQQADMAMSAAKQKQIEYMVFDNTLANDVKYRLKIASQLHHALQKKQFELHYQPLVKREKGSIYHFEALIRWPQEDGGFISPDKFIPIAEQNGLIKEITLWVLDQTAEHLQRFKEVSIDACIHINLSARDLQDEDFPLQLSERVKEQHILPHQLVLEVTETAMMTDMATTKKILLQLNQLGFLISLDDFGTGFSSLSLLTEFPIHQIKIDRSFVIPMQVGNRNHAIVRSTIILAHNLGCSVVAEGVETKALVDELQALQCDYLQGYYYSKPLPIEQVIKLSQAVARSNNA